MAETKKQGRPRGYTEDQVVRAIETVEAAGREPTGDTVKSVMCEMFGVSAGVNTQTLNEVVRDLVAERHERHMKTLVARLPTGLRQAALEFGRATEIRMLHALAPQFSVLETEAATEAEARALDNQALRAQVRDLRAELGERETHVANLEQERVDAQARIAALEADVAGLQAQLTQRKDGDDFCADLLARMREMIEGQSKGAQVRQRQTLPS